VKLSTAGDRLFPFPFFSFLFYALALLCVCVCVCVWLPRTSKLRTSKRGEEAERKWWSGEGGRERNRAESLRLFLEASARYTHSGGGDCPRGKSKGGKEGGGEGGEKERKREKEEEGRRER
jgi:hypothetical protein